MADLAPHVRVAPDLLPRATANAVVHLGLVVNVVMMPLEMADGPDAMMLLAAPGPSVEIAPGDRALLARLLEIAALPDPRAMMIATVLPATMILPLTRMRPPVSLIA